MRLLLVADVNSPIARRWAQYFAECGDEVYLISQCPEVAPPLPGVRVQVQRVAGQRMLSKRGNRSMGNLAGMFDALRRALGVEIEVHSVVA